MDMMATFLLSIRWQDIVDIAVNSYILFRLYILFRKTIVIRVITGIGLLWIFQRIAVSVGLIVTSWAMQGIIAAAALIIIIVFRNEIRSVLQAKNLKAILWGFPQHETHTPIEIIADSAFDLARRRCGALIVFPGKDDLEDMVQNGLLWNGLISKEMLASIFWHDNPVHDGAAVVKGKQIAEVGVILPLSRRNDFPSSYGTRHRAAAGLAEVTDALTVVVSEETGHVLVAKGSSIDQIQDGKELIQRLQTHLGIDTKATEDKKKGRLEIGLAVLISILLVTTVWFSFSRGMETLISLEVPVEYINRSPEMEIINTSVNTVSMQLSGSRALIRSMRLEQVNVKLDLSNAVVGLNTFSISKENITLPPGVLFKKVAPSVVEVVLDVPVEKVLPIQADWAGKMPDKLILYQAALDPSRVHIIGGSQLMENLSTIYTEAIPLESLKKNGTLTVNLALNPSALKLAKGSNSNIRITYVIKERQHE
jgi:diadenylate cyclase